ncbi:tRNA pseudouridine(38-40) synthase TruA [Blastopirellula retiformator]|uniref:tRNA pseudouridine synthase A n=1 Tax=Blastopirellula retiformator TaxID=2527970 RepID=A0A5C5V2N1_9BACT|nr:tRNA pseudouridine(38-40) synthase TruA [Blastopirellula retiformator]TWT31935.1 tRNA pseudouridine synthase A [Blastopirellula retiformator]
MSERTIQLIVSYDGTNYAGWQIQNDQPTIQESIEKALLSITGEKIRVTGSGRTDSGVHAIGQVVSFKTQSQLSADVLRRALNAELPADIVVRSSRNAASHFNAIDCATKKRYRYLLQEGRINDVFSRQYAWFVKKELDLPAMQAAAQHLIGEHDFASFEAAGSERLSTVRHVYDLQVAKSERHEFDKLAIEVEANGFLYNMVRIIVGTLVEVGKGKRPPEWVAEVLAAKDRTIGGMTAPAHGLYLLRVDYPESCWLD